MSQSRWSARDDLMYEHVMQNELERGRTTGWAEEIAAKTVSREHRKQGRIRKAPILYPGENPDARLEERTVDELRHCARDLHLPGRSAMTKAELIQAIRRSR
jgi:hypothetical protein